MKKLKSNEIKTISIDEFKNCEKSPLIIVLDNIRSALNVGSIFRTSDAFLIDKIMLCGITACPPQKDIRKSALGADTSVKWEYYSNTIDAINILIKKKYSIISVEQTSMSHSLEKVKLPKIPTALVFGNEINGVSQEVIDLCDESIEIPQLGTKHSLNVSVATGIVIWKYYEMLKNQNI
jgi:tRNA G18 (ribose-2'-O)-methylase SpoU